MSDDITGRCLCGAVTFAARTDKREVGVCHCGMCRRWSGGPFFAFDHEGEVRFTGAESIGVYHSSDWGERAFCKTCGSILYWKLQGQDHYALSAGALDRSEDLSLASEIFIDEKPAYYDFANETKQMTGAEFVAAFSGGGGETE